MYKTITGYLRKTESGHWMETGPNEYIEVYGVTTWSSTDIPINRLIALSVLDQVSIDGGYPVTDQVPAYAFLNKYMGDPVPLLKHIGIFKTIPRLANDEQTARQQDMVDEAARQVSIYLRTYGRHLWDIDVRGYVMRADDDINTHPPKFAGDEIDEFIEGHDMQGFEPAYLHVWGGNDGRYCGLAYKGGNRSVTFTNNDCGVRTMVHELFHNFGLAHAGLLKPDGSTTEYQDQSCIMGSYTIRGLNSPHVTRMGFDSNREIQVIDTDTAVWVAPIEMPAHGMHPQESQHIVVRAKGQPDVALSLRKDKGWPYPQPERTGRELYIHQVKGAATKLMIPTMRPGDTRKLPGGVTVSYDDVANTSALVVVSYDGELTREDLPPAPYGFPKNIPSAYIDAGHQGAWWDPDFYGQGLYVHIVGDTLAVAWYTFNQKDDCRRYYVGNAKLVDGKPAEFSLYSTTGGTFDEPSRRREFLEGEAQLYFFDGATGVFNFNTTSHGRGSIEIEPVALSADPRTGMYFQPDMIGSGFAVQFFGNQVSASWYTYGPKPPRPPIGSREIQDQRWYSCEGSQQDDGRWMLTIYEVSDGRWLELQETVVRPVGEALMVERADGKLAFTYDINAAGVKREGTYLLERVF